MLVRSYLRKITRMSGLKNLSFVGLNQTHLFNNSFKHVGITYKSFSEQDANKAKEAAKEKKEAKKDAPPRKEATKEASSEKTEKKVDNSVKVEAKEEKKEAAINTNTPKDADKKEPKAEIDQKWKDKLSKFREDWKEISDKNNQGLVDRLNNELTPHQRKFIEAVAERVANLNVYQFKHFNSRLQAKLEATSGMSLLRLNTDWPTAAELENPDVAPKFLKQQELMEQLSKWLGTQVSPVAGSGPQTQEPVKAQAPAKEEKKDDVKPFVDIELVSFDPAKKITLIKEVKNLLNLGLKEAKDAVEKVPGIIMKGVKKEDLDEIVKKLQDNGAKLNIK